MLVCSTGKATRLAKMAALETFLQIFLEANGVKKDSQGKVLLLHCTGQDVQDIFNTLTNPAPVPEHICKYAKAMRSLETHFYHQVNIPFERH